MREKKKQMGKQHKFWHLHLKIKDAHFNTNQICTFHQFNYLLAQYSNSKGRVVRVLIKLFECTKPERLNPRSS